MSDDDLRGCRGILNGLGLTLVIALLAVGAFYLFVP